MATRKRPTQKHFDILTGNEIEVPVPVSAEKVPPVEPARTEPEIVSADLASAGGDRTVVGEYKQGEDGPSLRAKYYPFVKDSIPGLLQAILGELIMIREGMHK